MEALKQVNAQIFNHGLTLFLALFIILQQCILFSLQYGIRGTACVKCVDKAIERSNHAIFKQTHSIEDMSYENDLEWAQTLAPKTGGFIWVKHNETTSVEFGISMFHALHCLQLLRLVSQEVIFGTRHPHTDERNGTHSVPVARHVPHCVGYLAQVTCFVSGISIQSLTRA
jgi:hypothetical protein